jgi:thioesterase domain-containing protein
VALVWAVLPNAPALAQDTALIERTTKPSPKRITQGAGHVYLLRGLLNVFSLGMDDLAAKIQGRGISASVHNHSEWQALADDIAAKYKAGNRAPIVLVGHSLGADAVMFMGEYLGKKGVPVALIVPFDGTGSFAASSNVARVMNLTQRDYAHMRRGPGFRGELANIDMSGQPGIDHVNIDKSARLHAMVLTKIQAVLGRGGSRTATPPSRPAQPAPEAAPAAPQPTPAATASTSGVSTAPTDSSSTR